MTTYSLDILLSRFGTLCCSMSSSTCCFLTCIHISQEADQVVWYSHLLQNFPQFIYIFISVKMMLSKLLVFHFSLSNGKFLGCRFQLQRYCEFLIARTWLYSAVEMKVKMWNLPQLLFIWKHLFLYEYMCAWVLSCFSPVQLFASLWTVACQVPLSMASSRQEYWSRVAIASSRGSSQLRDQTCISCSSFIAGGFFTSEPPGKSIWICRKWNLKVKLGRQIWPNGLKNNMVLHGCLHLSENFLSAQYL